MFFLIILLDKKWLLLSVLVFISLYIFILILLIPEPRELLKQFALSWGCNFFFLIFDKPLNKFNNLKYYKSFSNGFVLILLFYNFIISFVLKTPNFFHVLVLKSFSNLSMKSNVFLLKDIFLRRTCVIPYIFL